MIKVIGGQYRSRNLEVPASLKVPSKSIVRTGLSNALSFVCDGAKVLDLFAGSGALGIELLSRGASTCVFGDISPEACSCINQNLTSLKIKGCQVEQNDYQVIVEALAQAQESFDIILLDPPYARSDIYNALPTWLLEHHLLKEKGVLVIEYENAYQQPAFPFSKVKTYNYGRSHVDIFWR